MRERWSAPTSDADDGGRVVSGSSAVELDRLAQDRAQHRDHVGGFRHQRGALLEQLVAALRARIERRAGHREHLAALLEREAGGDQRARALRRLDDHHARRKARDEPVAAGKVARARLPAHRHFRDQARLPPGWRRRDRRARADRCGHGRRRARRRCRMRGSPGGRRRRCRGQDPRRWRSRPRRDRAPAARQSACPPPRHCARRRSRPSAAPARRALPRTASSGGASSIIAQALRIVRLAERDQASRRADFAACELALGVLA